GLASASAVAASGFSSGMGATGTVVAGPRRDNPLSELEVDEGDGFGARHLANHERGAEQGYSLGWRGQKDEARAEVLVPARRDEMAGEADTEHAAELGSEIRVIRREGREAR